MRGRQSSQSPSLVIRDGQPLIGVIEREGDHEVERYFVQEDGADAASSESATREALSAIGALSDLDLDQMLDALERIRHESIPTPPIEL